MSIKLTRDFYIPKGATKVAQRNGDGVVYLSESNGKFYALGFHGRAQKPDFNYSFRNAEFRERYIRDFFAGRAARAERIASNKIKKPRTLEINDVLYTSWGYDQTNVEFFQVVALIGETMVELREIAQDASETGFMSGVTSAIKDKFVGKPIRRRVLDGTSVKIDDVRYAHRWDGRPKGWTSYA